MHRSGTSFLSRALNLGGVFLGTYSDLTFTDWNSIPENKVGHWEHQSILNLSEETLSNCGGNWHEPPKATKINDELEQKIRKTFQDLQENGFLLSGFKDPRTIICFESWKKCFPSNTVFIGIFRHPLKVAESLKKRNGFSYEKSVELWKQYNSKLLQIMNKYQGFLLDFDSNPDKLTNEIKTILTSFGLNLKIDLKKWYNFDLKHADQTYKNNILDPETQSLYSELIKYSKQKINPPKFEYSNTDYLDAIENYSVEYKKMSIFFKKLLKEKDQETSNLQSSLSEKDQETSNLQSSLSEKDQETSNLQSSLSEKDQEISNLQSSLEETQKILNDIQNSFTWRTLKKFDRLKNR